jgi:hypothetical protein
MIVDTGRFLSDFAVRLSFATTHYEPSKRGRPSKRRLPSDPVERARKVGIDVEKLRAARGGSAGAMILRLREARGGGGRGGAPRGRGRRGALRRALAEVAPLMTDMGPIDLFRAVPGVGDYAACKAASAIAKAGEARLAVLDLDALAASRRATGRPRDVKDVIELEALEALGG